MSERSARIQRIPNALLDGFIFADQLRAATPDYQRVLQHSALFEIGEQRPRRFVC